MIEIKSKMRKIMTSLFPSETKKKNVIVPTNNIKPKAKFELMYKRILKSR